MIIRVALCRPDQKIEFQKLFVVLILTHPPTQYRGYKVIYPPLVFDNSNSFRANHQIFCENQALFENPAI